MVRALDPGFEGDDVYRFVKRFIDEVQPALERCPVTATCEQSSLITPGDRLEQMLQNAVVESGAKVVLARF